MLDYQAILEEINTSLKKVENTGEVASYIPELANVPKNKPIFCINYLKKS